MHRFGLMIVFSIFFLVSSIGNVQSQAIIIDHTCTDLSEIPTSWLDQAKLLTLHYAYTSHGSQIMSGIGVLETLHPECDFDSFNAGASPINTSGISALIFSVILT